MRPDVQPFYHEQPRPRPGRSQRNGSTAAPDAGDGSPLLSAFTTLRQKFRTVALRLLHDEAEADDVLQDAFCRLWTRRETIRTDNEAAALANVTVKHLCIDSLRRRKDVSSLDDGTLADLPDDSDGQQEREERFRAVEAAVEACLSPVQRQILRLRDYEGRPYADIAVRLGTTEEAVRMQLSRARKTVRQQWRCFVNGA